MNRQRIDAIFTGVLLLIIGILFLLDNMNVLRFSLWRFVGKFWPSILIYIGLKNIIVHLAAKE